MRRLGVFEGVTDSFENNVNHDFRGGQHRQMINGMGAHRGSHAPGLEMLGLRRNHPIILGDEKPRRLILPKWPWSLLLNALHVDRPLCSEEYRLHVGGRILGERMLEAFGRHPNKSAVIGA